MSDRCALLFDIGNTRVKWGVADGDSLRRSGSITHDRLHDDGFGALTTKLPVDVDIALASNVAGPSFATKLSGVVGLHCGRNLHFAKSSANGFGVINSYRQPRRMGVDRWVAMVGAKNEFSSALCVVDAGTAVTIDAIDRGGRHLGGQILPGFALMTEALSSDTSDLPSLRRAPKLSGDALQAFASSTGSAIYQGVLSAVCGAIDRAMRKLRQAGFRPLIVLTGGDASRILPELEGRVEHRPNLVLQGLTIMVQDR